MALLKFATNTRTQQTVKRVKCNSIISFYLILFTWTEESDLKSVIYWHYKVHVSSKILLAEPAGETGSKPETLEIFNVKSPKEQFSLT